MTDPNPYRRRTAADIGESNAADAIDQRHEYASAAEAFAAYLVNTVDTAREQRRCASAAVESFVRNWHTMLAATDPASCPECGRMPGAHDACEHCA